MSKLSKYAVGVVAGALVMIGASVLVLSFPAHSV
jgi:hypothetical protein